MASPTRYKPTYAWRTVCNSVILLTSETVNSPATYSVTVAPVDINDIGALLDVEAGMFLKDFIGHTYSIIDVNQNVINISDDFRVGVGPQSGRYGVVFKSVGKGRAPYLAPIYYRHLDKVAIDYSRQLELDILWRNDPNARRIAFSNILQPQISNYNTNLVDMDGYTFNPREDYEENPKFEIWTTVDNVHYSKQQVEPYITKVNGLISSVIWSGSGELISGYIVISK